MQTQAKSNSVVTHSREGGLLKWHVLGAGTIVLDPEQVSPENQTRAMIHGLVQRVSDGGALSRDPATGQAPSPQARFDAMNRIAEHLQSGSPDWELRRAARITNDEILILAIMEFKQAERAAVVEAVAKMDGKQKKGLLASDQLREIVARLRGENEGDSDVAEELLASI